MKKENYKQLVQFLFERNESDGDWRWKDNLVEPEVNPEELIAYVKEMYEQYDSELAGFSDWQLALGLEYIYYNTYSDISFALRDGPSPIDSRVSTILSLKKLFQKCLNPRCVNALGHKSEGRSRLNHFCYMLWDETPLTYCEDLPEKKEIYSACAEVMEYSLYLSNAACVESGLHGLGHLTMEYSESSKIIERYLKTKPKISWQLLEYANKAVAGNVL